MAVISVTDTGIGIASEFIPLVFDPFRRGEGAKNYPGLGIGMAISRRIITAHSGSIAVTSDGPGRGSTFTVRLPLAEHPG
jgi:signal transduction histidine kinase